VPNAMILSLGKSADGVLSEFDNEIDDDLSDFWGLFVSLVGFVVSGLGWKRLLRFAMGLGWDCDCVDSVWSW